MPPKSHSTKAIIEGFHKILDRQLKDFKFYVQEEFAEMKVRQDKINGEVSKNTQWRWMMIGFSTCITLIILPTAFMVVRIYLNGN